MLSYPSRLLWGSTYGMHVILATCEIQTEECVQMYIDVVSLILIFGEESKGKIGNGEGANCAGRECAREQEK